MIVGSSDVQSKHIPFVSMMIIMVCLGFFAKSYSLECMASREQQKNFVHSVYSPNSVSTENTDSLQEYYDDYGFQMGDLSNGGIISLFTHMFIHVDLFHIIGNLLTFWAFAVALEELFGSGKFTIFYLVCGLVACIGQGLCDIYSVVPMIGASGAVAGTMGAYVVLFGGLGKVKFLFFGVVWDIPAPAFAAVWLLSQVMMIADGGVTGGGVAIVAHLAGFGAGAAIGAFVKDEVSNRVSSDGGELKIESKESVAPPEEEDILAQLLECHPFGTVIEALGNPDVPCPECSETLDFLNPMGERLVRCTSPSCSKMTFVDANVLAGTLPD